MDDEYWMRRAIALALHAQAQDEVPVGAVLVKDNQVIGEGFNCPISTMDPSAHAEIRAIRQAGISQQNYRLPDTTLYVTLEPCAMCAGAIVQARIIRVVFGAPDLKAGACGSVFNILQHEKLNHRSEIVGGVCERECSQMLKLFFQEKRIIPSP